MKKPYFFVLLLAGISILSGCSANTSSLSPAQRDQLMRTYYQQPRVASPIGEMVSNMPKAPQPSETTGFLQKAEQICAEAGGVILLFRDTTKGRDGDLVQVTCKRGTTNYFIAKR